jgi:hypothetical protein
MKTKAVCGTVESGTSGIVLLPFLGGLLAVVGFTLVCAALIDTVHMPILVRGAGAQAIPAERPGPNATGWDAPKVPGTASGCVNDGLVVAPCQEFTREPGTAPEAIGAVPAPGAQDSGEGRRLDSLAASPSPDWRSVVLAAMTTAHFASREERESVGLASSPSNDLRADLAAMAKAQRTVRWTGSCPCPLQGGAIRCPANADSDDRIANAHFGPDFPPERSGSSEGYPCRMHRANRAEAAVSRQDELLTLAACDGGDPCA